MDDTSKAKSCSLMLLESVASLTKKLINWPAAQLDIIKKVIDFAITDVVYLNFKLHCPNTDENILCGLCWLQNSDSCKHQPHPMEEDKLTDHEKAEFGESEYRDETKEYQKHKANSDLVVSTECTACIDFLCQVIMDEWRVVLHWIQGDFSNSSVGEVDCSSWLPLHSWIIKLYAVAWVLVSHSNDCRLQKQAMKLQNGLGQYVKKHATETELKWIDGFKQGELIEFEESCFKEEFSSPLGKQAKDFKFSFCKCENRQLNLTFPIFLSLSTKKMIS